jgi:DNA-directed RNA polymerase specialized sigma24 family protein
MILPTTNVSDLRNCKTRGPVVETERAFLEYYEDLSLKDREDLDKKTKAFARKVVAAAGLPADYVDDYWQQSFTKMSESSKSVWGNVSTRWYEVLRNLAIDDFRRRTTVVPKKLDADDKPVRILRHTSMDDEDDDTKELPDPDNPTREREDADELRAACAFALRTIQRLEVLSEKEFERFVMLANDEGECSRSFKANKGEPVTLRPEGLKSDFGISASTAARMKKSLMKLKAALSTELGVETLEELLEYLSQPKLGNSAMEATLTAKENV